MERWQLLRDWKWVGPEWFYLPLMNPADEPPRVDALYVYTREWVPAQAGKPTGPPGDKNANLKPTAWTIS